MNKLLKAFLVLLPFLVFVDKSIALSDYEIRQICQKKRKRLTCIKNLEFKRSSLFEGKRIEIPVIDFKKK